MDEVVIVGAARTPIGKFQGGLSGVDAIELGAVASRAAIERAGVAPDAIDEVYFGNMLGDGLGHNPSRPLALKAGLPVSVSTTTVDKACGSGLEAVALAFNAARLGEGSIFLAGGTENMTRAPHLLMELRSGRRMGDATLVDSLQRDALVCAVEHIPMGLTVEHIASEFEIGREAQDAFAATSQRKAAAAIEAGAFEAEIVPVELPSRNGHPILFDRDEYPRPDSTVEALAKLRPAFQEGGTITAGNSSGINDGAAAVVLATRARADELGLRPLATIRGYASGAVEPMMMGIAPVVAIPKALDRAGVTLEEIDLIELNEAFAAQSLAVADQLGLDLERMNVHGGAIALGHPVGASGARVLVTLLYAMERRDARLGLAALCIGGGQGIAMVVERHG